VVLNITFAYFLEAFSYYEDLCTEIASLFASLLPGFSNIYAHPYRVQYRKKEISTYKLVYELLDLVRLSLLVLIFSKHFLTVQPDRACQA
jgi:hypothetical protein